MTIVDATLVKGHLRLDDDTDDDALVLVYQDAAEEAATEYLGRNVYATQPEVDAAVSNGDADAMLANASFTAAVLYAVAAMYNKREDATADVSQFPQESRRFLDPFRVGQGV